MYIRKELEKKNTNSNSKDVDQTNHVIDIVILLTEDLRSDNEGFEQKKWSRVLRRQCNFKLNL